MINSIQADSMSPSLRSAASEIRLDNVSHSYGGSVVVSAVNLSIGAGELVALLGPSGCGKTTLLRIVAGLLRQSVGTVRIGGDIVDRLPPNERGAGIVFQSYALFPHMTVERNVGYGLRARGVPSDECAKTVAAMLEMVRMSEFRSRFPRELSGGQQQRVALARTLAVRPKVLLLDEPFAALDKNLRLDMQLEIRRIQRDLGITTILVTHDQEEAMSMADRIAVMNAGRVEQYDTPEASYDMPQSLFVAGFIGNANLLPARLSSDGRGGFKVACGGGEIALQRAMPCSRDGAVIFAARPEHLSIGRPDGGAISACVEMVAPIGPSLVYELRLAGGNRIKVMQLRNDESPRFEIGQQVGVTLRPGCSPGVFVQ